MLSQLSLNALVKINQDNVYTSLLKIESCVWAEDNTIGTHSYLRSITESSAARRDRTQQERPLSGEEKAADFSYPNISIVHLTW